MRTNDGLIKKGFKIGLGVMVGTFAGKMLNSITVGICNRTMSVIAERGSERAQEFCEKYNVKYDKPESQEKTEK